ncbi:MAG: hypothetical protein HC857_17940 [Synechococcales cyanobacterium RU_4_20]|nr:hypothetical protein [Synechococcales cyanobacterium RU_4_20]
MGGRGGYGQVINDTFTEETWAAHGRTGIAGGSGGAGGAIQWQASLTATGDISVAAGRGGVGGTGNNGNSVELQAAGEGGLGGKGGSLQFNGQISGHDVRLLAGGGGAGGVGGTGQSGNSAVGGHRAAA